MYYVCKLFDSWTIYDGKKNTSRLLEKNEIDCLKSLFPTLLNDIGKTLTAVQVNSIQPNRLEKLTNGDNSIKVKKTLENVPKSTAN